jgi:hypothetical protein
LHNCSSISVNTPTFPCRSIERNRKRLFFARARLPAQTISCDPRGEQETKLSTLDKTKISYGPPCVDVLRRRVHPIGWVNDKWSMCLPSFKLSGFPSPPVAGFRRYHPISATTKESLRNKWPGKKERKRRHDNMARVRSTARENEISSRGYW